MERFWSKVNKSDGCWIWLAAKKQGGYGVFQMGRGTGTRLAHRVAYELVVGKVPEGLDLDHLCRVPACVNPAHLEPVTRAENTRRGLIPIATPVLNGDSDHCAYGHLYTGIDKRGYKTCSVCQNASNRRSRQKKARRG